jgi:hypothetical protein
MQGRVLIARNFLEFGPTYLGYHACMCDLIPGSP